MKTFKIKFYSYFIVTILLSVLFSQSLYLTIQGSLNALLISILLFVIFIVLYVFIRRDFLTPLQNLQNWAQRYKINNSDNITADKKTIFEPIAKSINHLIEEHQKLYDDMELIAQKQIQRLASKTAQLETLYEISSKLNQIRDTDSLVDFFLNTLINMTNASAGIVRLLTKGGNLQLTSEKGKVYKKGQKENVLSADCFCGDIALANNSTVQFSVHTCEKCIGVKGKAKAQVGTIFIPLRYQNITLGICNLFFSEEPTLDIDTRELLTAIGNHVALVLSRAKFEDERQRINLSQERINLSQEIHDSLAQTLVSLKLQTKVLADMIKINDKKNLKSKVDELEQNINQANKELRVLMKDFRMPLDRRGLIVSLHNLINKFKNETGIFVYFQPQSEVKLRPKIELQVFRIVQEALTNIKKHSNAKFVRVLFSCDSNKCNLLIEDDGIGISTKYTNDNLGVRIMKERAKKIGADLSIESEKDEGTRIQLVFKLKDSK